MGKRLSPTRVPKRRLAATRPVISRTVPLPSSPPSAVYAVPKQTAAYAFFSLSEVVLYHFLEACSLSTLIALSHTSAYFRTLVKSLFRIRLTQIMEHFITHTNLASFFTLLHETDSAIGGSTVARVLTGGNWMPSNLNLYVRNGGVPKWEEYLNTVLYFRCEKQPEVDRGCLYATSSHTAFESAITGHVIMISESVDESIITPAVSSSNTLAMSVITSSTIVAMYPTLMNKRQAFDSWDRPTVAHCITLQKRGFKHSASTTSWTRRCEWNCPVLWRRVQNLRGVGMFCWGGLNNNFPDNGREGIPFSDVSLKWRLSDVCLNEYCPWSSRRWV
ncbi:hypothetical protein R3P38DRAFT_2589382 [Favolaschia claudopus]|uniref:F-box domain-containing protein n=1 Tax=Favolaschia claudopus TaxID=2862362 RepID=A0AAV9Z1I2_9AGAR